MSTTGWYASATGRAPLDGLLQQVSGQRMAATVAAMSADRFTGRRVGSAGAAAARAWLGRRLADLGAAVRAEPFPVRAVPEVYAAPRVRWHDGDRTAELAFGRHVAVPVASADLPQPRRAGLGVAGGGDPTGRWLLVPAGMGLPDAYRHAEGAVGLLLARSVDADGWHFTMLAGPNPGTLPILALDPATHAAVHRAGASVAEDAWWQGNAPIRRVDVTAANVHGHWPASDRRAVRVLLTAHYDGVGDLPGLRQPGAADNASGVAVGHVGLPLAAGPVASDNRRYAAAGLPAVGIGAGMAGYHSPADIPGRVDPDTMVAVARLVLATVWQATTSYYDNHRQETL